MSFRLFIYYCALCGGGGAFVGWILGRLLAPSRVVAAQGVKGLWLGVGVALALGLLDALWNLPARRFVAIGLRVGTAVLIGSTGGLLGGVVSQALYQLAPYSAFLVCGWTFIGLLVGVSLGVLDLLAGAVRGQDPSGALRKIRNGLLGGSVGGLLGGVLSVLLHGAWEGLFVGKPPDRLWSPSATGFVALGACIGLLIGLAQVLLKEAWLRVEAGFRAGRELILSRPEVTIGRAEGCDIGLFGDPTVDRVHALIRAEDGRYVLSDAGSASGTYVNERRVTGPTPLRSGDTIRVGRCVLRFGERRKRG